MKGDHQRQRSPAHDMLGRDISTPSVSKCSIWRQCGEWRNVAQPNPGLNGRQEHELSFGESTRRSFSPSMSPGATWETSLLFFHHVGLGYLDRTHKFVVGVCEGHDQLHSTYGRNNILGTASLELCFSEIPSPSPGTAPGDVSVYQEEQHFWTY